MKHTNKDSSTKKRVSAASVKSSNSELDNLQYVIPLGGRGWIVKHAAASRYTAITDSKREAVKLAMDIARRRHHEVMVFDRKGKVTLHLQG